MFAAVDAIDAWRARKPETLPSRGSLPCPNCSGTLVYLQLTEIKGAARCLGTCGVDFAPLWRVDV